jgi:hypothetical protein
VFLECTTRLLMMVERPSAVILHFVLGCPLDSNDINAKYSLLKGLRREAGMRLFGQGDNTDGREWPPIVTRPGEFDSWTSEFKMHFPSN